MTVLRLPTLPWLFLMVVSASAFYWSIDSIDSPVPYVDGNGSSETANSNSSSVDCPCCAHNCIYSQSHLSCWDIDSLAQYPQRCASSVKTLIVYRGRFLNVSKSGLGAFHNLTNLTISQSKLQVLDALPERLIELDLNHNRLHRVNHGVLLKPINLVYLNLSHNGLGFIGEDLSQLSRLEHLDLSGNEWECSMDFQWALDLHDKGVLVNGNSLTCMDEKKVRGPLGSWVPWKYSVIKRERNKRIVDSECQKLTAGCYCEFASEGKEGRGSYTVQVDCSHRNLSTLPDKLPAFTTELDVTGNRLTNLDQVARYNDPPLKILIADSNQIHSIRNLSSSKFIRNFSRFSLQHNLIEPTQIPLMKELTEVPTEFAVKYLYLYDNAWECDCNMAKDVRNWLWSNRHIVNDSSLILCSWAGKKIPVLQLLPSVVCSEWAESTDEAATNHWRLMQLYLLIGVEILLILTCGVKFAYDSWRYVRHDELPWIAAKLF